MGAAEKLDLSDKDWLTVEEAAHYCGVSNSQFRRNALSYGLTPRRFMESSCTKERLSIPRSEALKNGKSSTLLAWHKGLPRLGGRRRALSPVHWAT